MRWIVATWLNYWLDNIALPPHISDNSHSGYRVDVEKHLIPGVGGHRLDRLEPEYLERLYAKMQRNGLAAGTAHHVHRTVRNALNEAVRRHHLGHNPALLAKAPRLTEEEPEPYDIEEIQRLLKVATDRRNGVRWVVALALGLHQGEALGLKWENVDLAKGIIRIRSTGFAQNTNTDAPTPVAGRRDSAPTDARHETTPAPPNQRPGGGSSPCLIRSWCC